MQNVKALKVSVFENEDEEKKQLAKVTFTGVRKWRYANDNDIRALIYKVRLDNYLPQCSHCNGFGKLKPVVFNKGMTNEITQHLCETCIQKMDCEDLEHDLEISDDDIVNEEGEI